MSQPGARRCDYSEVIEFPRLKAGKLQAQVIARRYQIAETLATGKRVLETGCGVGFGLGSLASVAKSVTAGDITSSALWQARGNYVGRSGLRLAQFDAQRLPFRDRSFDLVIAMAMVYYLDLTEFLEECRRVLQRDGLVFFCSPNPDSPGFKPSRLSTRYYSVPETVALVRRHGFVPRMFGAFPVRYGGARIWEWLIAAGATMLGKLIPMRTVREGVKDGVRRLIRYSTETIEGELTKSHLAAAQQIALEELPPTSRDTDHRILYCIARLSD